jgi:hypothetical protein
MSLCYLILYSVFLVLLYIVLIIAIPTMRIGRWLTAVAAGYKCGHSSRFPDNSGRISTRSQQRASDPSAIRSCHSVGTRYVIYFCTKREELESTRYWRVGSVYIVQEAAEQAAASWPHYSRLAACQQWLIQQSPLSPMFVHAAKVDIGYYFLRNKTSLIKATVADGLPCAKAF